MQRRTPLLVVGTMSETKYLIYRILFPNGKSYVGWTQKSLEQRKSDHWKTCFHKKRRYAVHNAILKCGFGNLKWEILYESNDQEFSLNIMEPYCIKLYNSHESKNGYNLTWGGDAPGLGIIQSEETKKKRSLSLKGKICGPGMTEEGRSKISVSSKRNILRKDSLTGKFLKSTHNGAKPGV